MPEATAAHSGPLGYLPFWHQTPFLFLSQWGWSRLSLPTEGGYLIYAWLICIFPSSWQVRPDDFSKNNVNKKILFSFNLTSGRLPVWLFGMPFLISQRELVWRWNKRSYDQEIKQISDSSLWAPGANCIWSHLLRHIYVRWANKSLFLPMSLWIVFIT